MRICEHSQVLQYRLQTDFVSSNPRGRNVPCWCAQSFEGAAACRRHSLLHSRSYCSRTAPIAAHAWRLAGAMSRGSPDPHVCRSARTPRSPRQSSLRMCCGALLTAHAQGNCKYVICNSDIHFICNYIVQMHADCLYFITGLPIQINYIFYRHASIFKRERNTVKAMYIP